MTFLKILGLTIIVLALAIFAAPFMLGVATVAIASRTPEGRDALVMAKELSPEMQRERVREAMERNRESASEARSSVVQTDYARSVDHAKFSAPPASRPGQPMMKPTPSR